jgi:hypothetical protein
MVRLCATERAFAPAERTIDGDVIAGSRYVWECGKRLLAWWLKSDRDPYDRVVSGLARSIRSSSTGLPRGFG